MLAHACPRTTKSKFRLLYLGTDLELLRALRRVLAESDYRLVACSDYESAILFLKSQIPYDLLLIDFEWKQREGLKLAEMVRSLRHRKRMPIVLVTATSLSRALKELARKSGVSKWVRKTPEAKAVIQAIKGLIAE